MLSGLTYSGGGPDWDQGVFALSLLELPVKALEARQLEGRPVALLLELAAPVPCRRQPPVDAGARVKVRVGAGPVEAVPAQLVARVRVVLWRWGNMAPGREGKKRGEERRGEERGRREERRGERRGEGKKRGEEKMALVSRDAVFDDFDVQRVW